MADLLPAGLVALIEEWNALPDGIGPRVAKPTSKPILAGWRRVQRDPEAREAFRDVPRLMNAIRGSPFLHGQSWFRFSWLFAKGKTGEWNARKILDGCYRDSRRNGAPTAAQAADRWARFIERGNQ